MAIVRYSLFADARGSINGQTFSRNRSGAYVRNRTNPINPATPEQDYQRNMFAYVAGMYQTLDSAQNDSWKSFAEFQTQQNALGEDYTPSAKQTFLKSNLNQMLIGSGMMMEAPLAEPTVPSLNLGLANFLAEADGGILMGFSGTGLANGSGVTHLIFKSTSPLVAVKESYRNSQRQISALAFTATPALLIPLQNALNGGAEINAEIGQILNLSVRGVCSANGLSTAWFNFRVPIVAA